MKQKDIIKLVLDTHLETITVGGGESAYDIAVRLGYTGTEEQWIESLHGAAGQTGAAGRDGTTPVKGVDYFDGEDGSDGKEVELQTNATHVQWRYVNGTWADLIPLTTLKGEQGLKGDAGSDATVTKQAVEAVLTGEISSHSHQGGSGGLTQAQILARQL